jgi:hypothetical protein
MQQAQNQRTATPRHAMQASGLVLARAGRASPCNLVAEDAAMEVIPTLERMTQIFSNATAPAFFLGAVAAFVSLMTNRLGVVRDRASKLQPGSDKRSRQLYRKSMERLIQRGRLLNDAILLTLCSGIGATLLLTVLFVAQFLGVNHAYGSALLFTLATLFLSTALFYFFREAWLARSETDDEFLSATADLAAMDDA